MGDEMFCEHCGKANKTSGLGINGGSVACRTAVRDPDTGKVTLAGADSPGALFRARCVHCGLELAGWVRVSDHRRRG